MPRHQAGHMTAIEPPPSLRAALLNPAGRPRMRAVVVAHVEATRNVLGEAAEMLPHALPDRLQRLEAGGLPGGVDADTLGTEMVDRDEHRRLALAGDRGRQVGAPHRVDRRGDDGAVMAARTARRADARRGEQIVLAHPPQHPPPRRPHAADAQPPLRWPFHQLRWRNL